MNNYDLLLKTYLFIITMTGLNMRMGANIGREQKDVIEKVKELKLLKQK
jgi:hypothetical protein